MAEPRPIAGGDGESAASKSVLSRRDFLKAGATTLAVVAVGASCRPGPSPTTFPFEALQFFNRTQAALVHAAAGRIIPGTSGDPGAEEAGW